MGRPNWIGPWRTPTRRRRTIAEAHELGGEQRGRGIGNTAPSRREHAQADDLDSTSPTREVDARQLACDPVPTSSAPTPRPRRRPPARPGGRPSAPRAPGRGALTAAPRRSGCRGACWAAGRRRRRVRTVQLGEERARGAVGARAHDFDRQLQRGPARVARAPRRPPRPHHPARAALGPGTARLSQPYWRARPRTRGRFLGSSRPAGDSRRTVAVDPPAPTSSATRSSVIPIGMPRRRRQGCDPSKISASARWLIIAQAWSRARSRSRGRPATFEVRDARS
jgi:hypothetical protein